MRLAAIVCAVLLLVGCAANRRDYVPPPAPTVPGYGATPPPQTASADVPGGASQRFRTDLDIPAQWWTLFHSAALNDLIDRALRANPDLAAAQAALRQAREQLLAQKGALSPTVDGSYTINPQKSSDVISPTLTNSANPFTLSTAQVSVAYTPDVFHGIRYQVQSAAALAEAQRFALEATYLTLTSNLVAAAVGLASVQGQIAATHHLIAIDDELLAITRKQKALGQAAGLDVAAQETALAQAEQTLPPLEKQLGLQRDLVATLAGAVPNETERLSFELTSLHLPEELPLSLPAKLVEQRPDVRVAEANLHSASALVGAAAANRWPNFALNGSMGSVTTTLLSFFSPGSSFYNLLAGATQPIFDGGTLKHRQKAAEAAYDQAAAQYRSTVLGAFQNVADTLHALDRDAEALRLAVKAERAATASLEIVRKQQRLGQVAYLSVLSAELAQQQTQLALVQAEAARYADTAALFQALGGGWWNR